MKALNELNRRQIRAATRQQDADYGHSLSLERPSRPQLRAVPVRQKPSPSDSKAVEDARNAIAARNSQMFCSAGTNRISRAFNNNVKRITTPMLTTEEFIQVKLATLRESTRHCFWPADVLERFAAADVIRLPQHAD